MKRATQIMLLAACSIGVATPAMAGTHAGDAKFGVSSFKSEFAASPTKGYEKGKGKGHDKGKGKGHEIGKGHGHDGDYKSNGC